MKSDTLITVIVTTYNRPDALELVLAGCLAQTDRHFEIVVADDGSGPATREVIERAARHSPIPVKHVWHPDDGFRLATIRNEAIAQARGEYLIFLDGDCVPQRDFVARHRTLAAPHTVVTGSRILVGPELTARAVARDIPLIGRSLVFWLRQRAARQVNKILPIFLRLPDMPSRRTRGFVWRGIKGCNLAAWRADVVSVNGFDGSFVGWGHEDADFVVRLHNAGVGRKKGFLATEVLHLWHPEAARDREGQNYDRVRARLSDGTTRAEKGLEDCALVP